MTIKTRIRKLLDLENSIYRVLRSRNPNDLIYISTVKPIDKCSIKELEEYLETRKIIEEAVKLIDIIQESQNRLKEIGYDVYVQIK